MSAKAKDSENVAHREELRRERRGAARVSEDNDRGVDCFAGRGNSPSNTGKWSAVSIANCSNG